MAYSGQPTPLPAPVVTYGGPEGRTPDQPGGAHAYDPRDLEWQGRWSDGVFNCGSDGSSCFWGTVGLIINPIFAYFKAWPLDETKILHWSTGFTLFFTLWSLQFVIPIVQQALSFIPNISPIAGWMFTVLSVVFAIALLVLNLHYRTKLRAMVCQVL